MVKMVSYIWFFLIIIGVVYSFLTGNIGNINESILTNGNEALELMLSIFPVIVLWSGIMKIAEDAQPEDGITQLTTAFETTDANGSKTITESYTQNIKEE